MEDCNRKSVCSVVEKVYPGKNSEMSKGMEKSLFKG